MRIDQIVSGFARPRADGAIAAVHPRLIAAARLALLLVVLIASAVALAGCKKNDANAATASNDPLVKKGDYIGLYQARRFPEARTAAEAAMSKSKDKQKEIAALTAGMSAHAMGDQEGAKRLLVPLTGSKDPQISGRAEATLGQIAQKQGQTGYAAGLFKNAGSKLEGDDAARANVRAGNALTAMGQHAQAIQSYKAATTDAESKGVKDYAESLSEPGPFAVQAGVFSSRPNAEARARQVQAAAIRYGYGTPRVVPATLHGKTTYTVKIGVFPTRQAATDAKSKLGNQQMVVVTAN